jgi:hypothetical protein
MDIVVMCQPNEYTTLNYKQQGMRDKSKRSRCDENSYQEGDVEMQGICLRQSGSVLSFAILRSGGKLKSVRTPRIAFLQPGTHTVKRLDRLEQALREHHSHLQVKVRNRVRCRLGLRNANERIKQMRSL